MLIHNRLYKSIKESSQHHHGRASSPHQRQEETKPEILKNKNPAQRCQIDSPALLPQAWTPGPLCTAPTPPGCSGSPGLPAGTSLSPARPCVGRTANLPEKN